MTKRSKFSSRGLSLPPESWPRSLQSLHYDGEAPSSITDPEFLQKLRNEIARTQERSAEKTKGRVSPFLPRRWKLAPVMAAAAMLVFILASGLWLTTRQDAPGTISFRSFTTLLQRGNALFIAEVKGEVSLLRNGNTLQAGGDETLKKEDALLIKAGGKIRLATENHTILIQKPSLLLYHGNDTFEVKYGELLIATGDFHEAAWEQQKSATNPNGAEDLNQKESVSSLTIQAWPYQYNPVGTMGYLSITPTAQQIKVYQGAFLIQSQKHKGVPPLQVNAGYMTRQSGALLLQGDLPALLLMTPDVLQSPPWLKKTGNRPSLLGGATFRVYLKNGETLVGQLQADNRYILHTPEGTRTLDPSMIDSIEIASGESAP